MASSLVSPALNSPKSFPEKDMPSSLTGPLFATPTKAKPASSTVDRGSLGYLVFPLSSSSASPSRLMVSPSRPMVSHRSKPEIEQKKLAAEYEARRMRDAELHRARLERERAEALLGEEEWVRSGGVLRDSEGKRDYARTEAIRAELKLRDKEKALRERWEKYEDRWKRIREGAASAIRFHDVPWPVDVTNRNVQLEDLTIERIEPFLLDGLTVRGCKVTKKERVRSSLLRWHPDKLTGLLSKVEKDDVDAVGEGIGIVVRCLHQLNTHS
ncbi:hypothetical protein C8J56DRAFT_832757 [Mycena floridula]|nr:hypothetical protein C8J56DRAFT_832757 [Mycena floridula]